MNSASLSCVDDTFCSTRDGTGQTMSARQLPASWKQILDVESAYVGKAHRSSEAVECCLKAQIPAPVAVLLFCAPAFCLLIFLEGSARA